MLCFDRLGIQSYCASMYFKCVQSHPKPRVCFGSVHGSKMVSMIFVNLYPLGNDMT